MRIAREEIFGPVASVIPFKDENDAILQGNDTTYGLAAAVWTRDVSPPIRLRVLSGLARCGSIVTTTLIRSHRLAATNSPASVVNLANIR